MGKTSGLKKVVQKCVVKRWDKQLGLKGGVKQIVFKNLGPEQKVNLSKKDE